jgi:replicative DNA helicase
MNARHHAERAVLGAILNDPRELAGIRDWLAPEDFYAPQHAELYRAMITETEREFPDLDSLTPVERATVLIPYGQGLIGRATEAGVKGIDAPFLHTLMHVCPKPERAPHYARMVVEADTHRVIIENATRLAQLAHGHQESPFGLEHLFTHTAAFQQVLTHLADRWGLTEDDLTQPGAEHPATADTGADQTGRFADQLAPELDAKPTAEQLAAATEREDMLLACVLRSPDQLDGVRAYLKPDDFTAPGRGRLYQAALDIHTRGDPVDPVTLIWESQKHDTHAAPEDDEETPRISALDGDDLMRLYGDGLPAETAPYYARRIIESAILTTTTQAARDLKTLASNPRLNATELIPAAAHRITQLDCDEERWNNIHAPNAGDLSTPDPNTQQAPESQPHDSQTV